MIVTVKRSGLSRTFATSHTSWRVILSISGMSSLRKVMGRFSI